MLSNQPAPKPGKEDVDAALLTYMKERAKAGKKKYGTPLQTANGRDALLDALDESIDQTKYLMQAYLERLAFQKNFNQWLNSGQSTSVLISVIREYLNV